MLPPSDFNQSQFVMFELKYIEKNGPWGKGNPGECRLVRVRNAIAGSPRLSTIIL
jgi:hypothetical protein